MNQYINMEVKFFLMSIAWGAILLIIYDCIRIFRKVIKHGAVLMSLEDIIYWTISAVLIFRMMYQLNDGIIRGFSLLGILLGMVIYKYSISEFIVNGISFVLIKTKHFLLKMIHIILKPIQFIERKIHVLIVSIRKSTQKKIGHLAHFAHNYTRTLCKALQNKIKRSNIKKRMSKGKETNVSIESKKL